MLAGMGAFFHRLSSDLQENEKKQYVICVFIASALFSKNMVSLCNPGCTVDFAL